MNLECDRQKVCPVTLQLFAGGLLLSKSLLHLEIFTSKMSMSHYSTGFWRSSIWHIRLLHFTAGCPHSLAHIQVRHGPHVHVGGLTSHSMALYWSSHHERHPTIWYKQVLFRYKFTLTSCQDPTTHLSYKLWVGRSCSWAPTFEFWCKQILSKMWRIWHTFWKETILSVRLSAAPPLNVRNDAQWCHISKEFLWRKSSRENKKDSFEFRDAEPQNRSQNKHWLSSL